MAKKKKKAVKKKKAKKKRGRKTSYRKTYCEKIIKYFDIETTREVEVKTIFKNGTEKISSQERANHLRFFGKFAQSIGTTHATLLNWTKKYPDFLEAYTRAKELQKEHLVICALLGLYNPIFAKFTATNITDMRDQQTTELKGVVGTREISKEEMAELVRDKRIPCDDAIAT